MLQGPGLSSGGGLQSLHVVTHGGALVDRRGGAVAREPLSRAPVLAADLMVAAVLLASLRRGWLLALGNVAGPRSVQREERALDQLILQRVDELFRLQRREGEKKTREAERIERMCPRVNGGRGYFCCQREGPGRKCCLMGAGIYKGGEERKRKPPPAP